MSQGRHKNMPLYNQQHCFYIFYNNEVFIPKDFQKQVFLRLDTERRVWNTSLLLEQFPLHIWPTRRSIPTPLYRWLRAYLQVIYKSLTRDVLHAAWQSHNFWFSHPSHFTNLTWETGIILCQEELLHALRHSMPGSRLPSSLPVPAQTPGKWDSFREGLDGIQFKNI